MTKTKKDEKENKRERKGVKQDKATSAMRDVFSSIFASVFHSHVNSMNGFCLLIDKQFVIENYIFSFRAIGLLVLLLLPPQNVSICLLFRTSFAHTMHCP